MNVVATARGLIFDCDGTLVDSMPLHMAAWEHAIRQFAPVFERGFIDARKGMKEIEIVALYNQHFGTTLDASAVLAEKHGHFLEHLHEVRPFGPVVDVVRQSHGVLPMAVVSGGIRDVVAGELTATNLAKFFDVVLTADDPLPPKPAPDLFLEAARRMGVRPSDCQVFEDGDVGLEAARRAGMMATDVRPWTGQEAAGP